MKKTNVLDGQVTKNFNLKEFRCRHCGDVIVNGKTVMHMIRLQVFRDWYKRPMIINSGYRCSTHNINVGGVKNSLHLLGVATDFQLPQEFYNFTNERKSVFMNNIIRKWKEIGGGTIGIYDSFIHLDSKDSPFRMFDSRKNKTYTL